MATRCSNVVLRATPEFRDDFEFTAARVQELASAFTRFLMTGIKSAYFAETDLFAEFAFEAGAPTEHRLLITEFCRGVFDAPSKGKVANHAMPFMCRWSDGWERDWGANGVKRGKTYPKHEEQWKNHGLRLLDHNVLPVVNCSNVGILVPGARKFALSTLYNVIARLDSTRKAMQRWLDNRNKIEVSLSQLREESAVHGAKKAVFAGLLNQAIDSGLVRVNGRLQRNWRKFRSRNQCQDCYRDFFDALVASGLQNEVELFLDEILVADELAAMRVPTPRLPGIDVPVDLHLGLSTSIYLTPKVDSVAITKPRRVRPRDDYRTFLFSIPLMTSTGGERTHRIESLYSGYFESLAVSNSDKYTNLTFSKNGRNALFQATLKEFDLGLNDEGQIVARISHNLVVDDELLKARNRISNYFTGLHPNAPFPVDDLKAGDRVVTIDLGINPLFAWAVCRYQPQRPDGDEYFDVDGGGFAEFVENRAFERRFADDEREVDLFSERVRTGRQLLNYYKQLYAGRTIAERWLPVDHLKRLGLGADVTKEDLLVALAGKPRQPGADGRRTLSERRDGYIAELRRDFSRLKDRRPGHATACLAQYKWAEAVGDFISVMKAWSRKHRDPKEKGRTYQDRDFETYHNYQRNLRRDLCRKIADEIVQIAERHQARVVVFERLFGFRPSQTRERAGNRLLANWARAQIVEAAKLALEVRSIAFGEVDPRHTSQRDPLTGDWGYRDPDYKTIVYVRRGDEVRTKHADKYVAVLNLQRKFWNRGTDLVYVKASETVTGDWVAMDFNKTLERASQRLIGRKRFLLMTDPGGHLVAIGVSERDYETAKAGRIHGRRERHFFRHGERWLDSDSHYEETARLKSEYQAPRRGDFEPDAIAEEAVG